MLRQLRLLPVGDSGTPGAEDVLLGSWNGVAAVSFRYEWAALGSAPAVHQEHVTALALPDAAETTILVDGTNPVAMRHGFLAVDQIEPTLALLADLAALVPDFVWQDARGHRRG